MLEEKRDVYSKLIETSISINKREKRDEESINKLTEYKNEIENVKTLSEIEKVWLRILEDEKSHLLESVLYGVLDRNQTLIERTIELYPEDVRNITQSKSIIERYKSCKKMLIEGNRFITVSKEMMRPLMDISK